MDLGSIKIYFELDHFLVSSFVGGMFINNGFFLISFMGFKDCSLFVLVDEERQEMQWEELGEEGVLHLHCLANVGIALAGHPQRSYW